MWTVRGKSSDLFGYGVEKCFFVHFSKKQQKCFPKQFHTIFQFNYTDLSKRETPEFTGRAGVFLLSTAPKANKAEKIYLFLYMRNVGKEFYTYENRM